MFVVCTMSPFQEKYVCYDLVSRQGQKLQHPSAKNCQGQPTNNILCEHVKWHVLRACREQTYSFNVQRTECPVWLLHIAANAQEKPAFEKFVFCVTNGLGGVLVSCDNIVVIETLVMLLQIFNPICRLPFHNEVKHAI